MSPPQSDDTQSLRENLLLGIGNPLLDISANVSADLLDKYGLKANDAILADPERHAGLYADLIDNYSVDYIAGGSVQNTLRVAQWFLGKPKVCTFFGCVGKDACSAILERKASENGVDVHYQYTDQEKTGTCAVLITDVHRSLCANLAAANCFTIDHVQKPENAALLDAAKYIYISGFFITVSPSTIMHIARHALQHHKPLIMNLSAPFVPQLYKNHLVDMLPHVDVLICNETEAQSFATVFELSDANQMDCLAKQIANFQPKHYVEKKRICVLTQGTEPVIVAEQGAAKVQQFKVQPLSTDQIVDTNGAGDAFVGGFLAQYIQQRPIDECIRCGIWAASQIVQRSGCTFEGKPITDFHEPV